MFTMSPRFDSALIQLMNIYADYYDTDQVTRVYNNGVMQVRVIVSVNYNGETSALAINNYVQSNAVIYSLNHAANVDWVISTVDNGFHHDIDRAANKNASVSPETMSPKTMSPKIMSDVRVPFYITVPGGTAEGEHRWIAKLDGKQTNPNKPLTVIVETFKVEAHQFDIIDISYVSCVVLRALKYSSSEIPDAQKLVQSLTENGILFSQTFANSWVSMAHNSGGRKLGAFLNYKVDKYIKVAKSGREYEQHEIRKSDYFKPGYCDHLVRPWCNCLDNTKDIDSADINTAWNEGVAMLLVRDGSVSLNCDYYRNDALGEGWFWHGIDFHLNPYILQDTFGCMVEVSIWWNADGWYGSWAVQDAKVVYP